MGVIRVFLLATVAVVISIVLASFLLTPGDGDDEAIRLGVLLNMSDTGDPDTQVAVRLALEDLQAYFDTDDSPFRVELVVARTGLDADTARSEIEALSRQGVRVIIGPESSAEIEAIRSFTDDRDMLAISHCASAPSHAIAGDSIFRMVPSDAHQAGVLAALLRDDGIETLVPVWRADVWGDGIQGALAASFTTAGGSVRDGVRYDPSSTSFEADLQALARQVTEARSAGGNTVAVVFLGFGPEAPAILSGAAAIPALADVPWYGSEGSVLSREIILDAAAARFAVETGFLHPMFAEVNTPFSQDVRSRISDATSGGDVHYCATAAYDAVRLAAMSAVIAGTDDVDAFQRAFRALAGTYDGASGRTGLDEAGDRNETGYDLWAIRPEGSGFAWTRIGPAGE